MLDDGGASAKRPGPAADAALDPARLVELDKTYDYVRANSRRMIAPEGMVSVRPPSGARHAEKIGAFRFEGHEGVPSMFVVLGVEGDTANVVYASINDVGRSG